MPKPKITVLEECQALFQEHQASLLRCQDLVDECQAVLHAGQALFQQGQALLHAGQALLQQGQGLLQQSQALLQGCQALLQEHQDSRPPGPQPTIYRNGDSTYADDEIFHFEYGNEEAEQQAQ